MTLKHKYPSMGLINNKEDWYEVRTLIQQDMMRPKSALYYTREMEEIASDVVGVIEEMKDDENCFEINRMCQEFALEAVAYVFLGNRLNTLKGGADGKRMIDIVSQTGDFTQKMMFLPHWSFKFIPAYHKFCKLNVEMMDLCQSHLDRAKERAEQTGDKDSMIAKLVGRCGKDSAIPLIVGIDSMSAGIDTTGSSACFLLYHLATNPDKQEILHKEITDVVGAEGKLTESALGKMKYMKAVQLESQRILPAIWGTSRYFERDVVIGGYRIPKETTVVKAGSFTAMDDKNFVDPDTFMPERWLRGHKARHSADSFANIPFGHGAR